MAKDNITYIWHWIWTSHCICILGGWDFFCLRFWVYDFGLWAWTERPESRATLPNNKWKTEGNFSSWSFSWNIFMPTWRIKSELDYRNTRLNTRYTLTTFKWCLRKKSVEYRRTEYFARLSAFWLLLLLEDVCVYFIFSFLYFSGKQLTFSRFTGFRLSFLREVYSEE